jgi:hypothetical protein
MPKGSCAEKRKEGREKFAYTVAGQSSHPYNVREKLRPRGSKGQFIKTMGKTLR